MATAIEATPTLHRDLRASWEQSYPNEKSRPSSEEAIGPPEEEEKEETYDDQDVLVSY